jgi:UDP-N-acetylmuramoyl-tripeptide--D-alanyl-D-alanine ligase
VSILLFSGATIGAAALLVPRLLKSLHMLQLDGYKPSRYLKHGLDRTAKSRISLGQWLLTCGVVLIWVATGVFPSHIEIVMTVWGIVAAANVAVVASAPMAKKPLVWTARMVRLAAAAVTIALVPMVAVAWREVGASSSSGYAWLFTTLAIYTTATPIFALLAVTALEPLELLLRAGFVAKARKTLRATSPLVIGIAGSFGKTTTKSALSAVLSPKFRVVATPESYNTLLGVTKTINDLLVPDTDILIVEIGARHRGDVAEVCRLAQPSIGVITRLGEQHLEYFGTIENIIAAKTELLGALPDDGLAIVDADGVTDFSQQDAWSGRLLRVSGQPQAHTEYRLEHVSLDTHGTTFNLVERDGTRHEFSTRLLGSGAAMDCALACVVALNLGVHADAISQALASMPPVPHRLQVVRDDRVTVIDDAFNSNPQGFVDALHVLSAFANRRRIVVTPGMVELGPESVRSHELVADAMTETCDFIMLIGDSWPAEFRQRLLANGFPSSSLFVFDSLDESTEFLGSFLQQGDVVLYENDLPDNY